MDAKSSRESANGSIVFASMAALITAIVLALGAVGVVAVAGSDSTAGTPTDVTTVNVTLTEFKITLDPPTVPAGNVVLHINNAGAAEHNVEVAALNMKTANIAVGGQTTLDLGHVMSPVELICNIPGHKESGMAATLGIGEGTSTASDEMTMSNDQMDAAMSAVAKRFPEETTGTGNGELQPQVLADGTKQFDLTASIVDWEVEKGKIVKGWAYNGQIPGPVMHVNVGDKVRIVLKNELPESTSMHLHGIRVPNSADGVDPYTQDAIKPGDTYTYEFTALEPGVGMYHSHHNAQVQVPNGLAGAILVGDWKTSAMKVATGRVKDSNGKAEQEVVMVLNDAGTIGLSLNGKSFPATSPYEMAVGESMVVHYFNEGLMSHPMHLHQPSGLVVAHDGKLLESPFFADTINVAPGERWTVVYTALDKGVWAWHCHILNHAETATGMKYMVTAVIVK